MALVFSHDLSTHAIGFSRFDTGTKAQRAVHFRHKKNLISEFSEKLVITHPTDRDKSQKELTSGEDDTGSPLLVPPFSFFSRFQPRRGEI